MSRRILLLPIFSVIALSQTPDGAFFESKIRPVLATKCYGCHSSSLKAPMGGLVLDTKAGLAKSGVVVPGKPADSRLLQAIRYVNPNLQMPPTGKLPDNVIADFQSWIAAGAPDPRVDATAASQAPAPLKGMPIEQGRQWWAFQLVHETPAPRVKDSTWPKTKIDAFLLSKLEEKNLKPSPPADARTLAERAYIDLLGYKPTYQELEAFAADKSPNAYAALVDRLLASPHYGERWGRHWMDVTRFGEDNPTGEATNPGYPYAWRYRDWVIEALNQDVPYDRFVKMQLAADEMPDVKREDLRALGYLGAAPIYHKDQRLSRDVIYGFMTDDWDERVDAVSRGLLGLTVACARCHDHKFDPILTKDYYALAGVFASTMRAERPTFDVDPQTEERFMWIQRRLFDLRYSADLLTNEASTVVDAAPRVAKWKAEIGSLHSEMDAIGEKYPQLEQHLARYWTFPPPRSATPRPPAAPAAPAQAPPPGQPAAPPVQSAPPPTQAAARPVQPAVAAPQGRRGANPSSKEPFMNVVYDAAQYVDGSDEHYTFINYKAGEARDLPVFPYGNVATPGEIAPRQFLTVLSKGDTRFQKGSGRLELADRIFTDSAPLAARVIVNRVWDWHFGHPLVATTSDFGTQGEPPSHPELLDDLSARFIAHGWSMKWLHREIMLSAAYQQSSHPRADAETIDQMNSLLWRMNPRRMDIESYRDSLLRSAGKLSEEMYGPSDDLDNAANTRRTVYGRVSRARINNLLRQYDFPDPIQTAGVRDLTTTSLQQLFLMNSPFIHGLAVDLAASVADETNPNDKITALYRRILARDPSAKELDLAISYLIHGSTQQYAQILLSTNEEIFWP
jgi:Protein of unknown function (DUF1553)/Protein of unknown function (DUF1549)/Planctomycete cytochrome C